MFNWKDNTKNTDEELAAEAARIMYYPGNQHDSALRYVIEALVMPEDVSGYTEEDMAAWILEKLRR